MGQFSGRALLYCFLIASFVVLISGSALADYLNTLGSFGKLLLTVLFSGLFIKISPLKIGRIFGIIKNRVSTVATIQVVTHYLKGTYVVKVVYTSSDKELIESEIVMSNFFYSRPIVGASVPVAYNSQKPTDATLDWTILPNEILNGVVIPILGSAILAKMILEGSLK